LLGVEAGFQKEVPNFSELRNLIEDSLKQLRIAFSLLDYALSLLLFHYGFESY